MNTRRFTLPARAVAAGGAALGIVALSGGAASAHVTITPSTTEAGANAILTFSNGHGCEGSPTTRLTIAMPEEIPVVTPTVHPNWTVEKVTETLDEPIEDAHGNQITDRISQVVYTAKTPLEDGFRDTVELSVKLPDAEGTTLAFPVIQTCEEGETAWNETAAEGQDPHDLDSPAPTVTIGAASTGGHGDEAVETDTDTDADTGNDTGTDKAEAAADDDSSNGMAIGGLAAGVAGLVLGGAAFVRAGKKA